MAGLASTVIALTAGGAVVYLTGLFRVSVLVLLAAGAWMSTFRFAYRVRLGPDGLAWDRLTGSDACDLDQVLEVATTRRSTMVLVVHVMGGRRFMVGQGAECDRLLRDLRRLRPDLPTAT